MGSLLPLSITTNCTMKSLLIFATILAVGLSEETKAVVAPYHYGIPGIYGGAIAPFAYNAAPLNYAYAPYAQAYAPYAQAYAPAYTVAAAPAPVVPVPAPAVSSQFAAGDEFGNTQYGYSNLHVADAFGFGTEDSRLPVHVAELPVAPVHEYELPVAPVHEYELPVAPVHEYTLPVAPVYDGVAPTPVEDTPEVAAAKAEHLAAVAEVASRKKRESDPMRTFGYNSAYLLNPYYQRVMHNGIYAYNHLGYMGSPRFSYGFYHY